MTTPQLTAIGSGKGGTGKTLIAVALAQALSQDGERVLLCDADLGLSNAAIHLGLDECGDLVSLLEGACRLEDAVVPVLGGAGSRGGFDLLAAPAGSGALANIGPIVAENLAATLRHGGGYTRVLLDLPAGVGAQVLRFATAADATLLVLTPDPASLTDAYAFVKLMLRATGTRLPAVLVNMAASDADARRTEEAMAATCSAFLNCVPEFLGRIPRDPQVRDAVRHQRPLLSERPPGAAARAVAEIAHRLHRDATTLKVPPRAAGMR